MGVEVGANVVVVVGSIGACVVVVDNAPLDVVEPVVVVDVTSVVLEEGVVVVVDVVLDFGVDDEDVMTPKSMSRRCSPCSRWTM